MAGTITMEAARRYARGVAQLQKQQQAAGYAPNPYAPQNAKPREMSASASASGSTETALLIAVGGVALFALAHFAKKYGRKHSS